MSQTQSELKLRGMLRVSTKFFLNAYAYLNGLPAI